MTLKTDFEYRKSMWGHAVRLFRDLRRRVNNPYKTRLNYKEFSVRFTREEFLDWIMHNSEYKRLYKKWAKSGFDAASTPTVDRINESDKFYSLGRIQILTKTKNARKSTAIRSKAGKTKSRYIGVMPYYSSNGKRPSKYVARITVNHQSYWLGSYKKAAHAALAVNKAYRILGVDKDLVVLNSIPENQSSDFIAADALKRLAKSKRKRV
jgi:hypothetical protein